MQTVQKKETSLLETIMVYKVNKYLMFMISMKLHLFIKKNVVFIFKEAEKGSKWFDLFCENTKFWWDFRNVLFPINIQIISHFEEIG